MCIVLWKTARYIGRVGPAEHILEIIIYGPGLSLIEQ